MSEQYLFNAHVFSAGQCWVPNKRKEQVLVSPFLHKIALRSGTMVTGTRMHTRERIPRS